MWNFIIAMLHNLKTDRFHPILFYESPLPSSSEDSKVVRHKSKGHHTVGFDTREQAIEFAQTTMKEYYPNARDCIEKDFPWDGEDTPAMVVFFGENDGKLIPMF